ncbi:S41 family peptidase [Pseudomonadota bacterium]
MAITSDPVRQSDDQVSSVVNQVVESIRSHYVLVDKRAEISGFLESQLTDYRYDNLDQVELAARLTDDLRKISNDKHMRVQYSPERYGALSHGQSASELAEEIQYWEQQAIKSHYGIAEVRQLDGHIGYLKLTGFWTGDEAHQYMDSALTLLRHDDALIFDLRGNKGGESEMVTYLTSILLDDSEPRLLGTLFDGMSGETISEYSVTGLTMQSLADKSLYVLINDRTYSAGEAFAQHVKNFHLGTLVGQTTAGAAHTVELLPIEEGFVLTLSTGRVEHALTGEDWEGTGVEPQVITEPGDALRAAQELAQRELASRQN